MPAKNQRVTLERPNNTTHPKTNEKIAGWAVVGKAWAELKPLTSREVARSKQIQLDASHRLKIHYRTDLDTSWRVRWSDPRGSHTATIVGIVETVRRAELELQLNETTDG